MGRLRNLSESFRSSAFFHNSSNSHSPPGLFKTEIGRSTNASAVKEIPPLSRDNSDSSLPQSPPLPPTTRGGRTSSRPVSMLYGAMGMERKDDQVEELLPVFSFLSSHSNKLYQEGYFLKLNDLDTSGRPYVDRNWTECFAQLVGTVLSLWDAAALDAAGQDGEVAPTFINLADASIKMIETLPTRNQDVQPLQNVLSISTAGRNRYLLHFSSLHSLTQWTAGIRLSMFEHTSLQELYTGSLIAGKGKTLNNIRSIMERTRFRSEDWARVRFGAGTPWRRCWCVIEPPDEKEWLKAQKALKKRSAYERPHMPKGSIKFYDTKKIKKATPIATITDAYSAYAIYPQSKPLIDQSTLVKVEGRITIHSQPESKTEGFVFVMPELHAAVSGFEMLLRWLFPVYDCFHLYGRPNRLIADTFDARGLMFAMPKERRYGYLEIIDVASLIHTDGSNTWSEREWRKKMKDMTSKRMNGSIPSRPSGNFGSARAQRNSTGSRNEVRFDEARSGTSSPLNRQQRTSSAEAVYAPPVPPITLPPNALHSLPANNYHARSVSESVALPLPTDGRRYNQALPYGGPTTESMQAMPLSVPEQGYNNQKHGGRLNVLERGTSKNSSDSELPSPNADVEAVNHDMRQLSPPSPVMAPPNFQHSPGDRPQKRPDVRLEARREKARMSTGTLSQMAELNKPVTPYNGGTAGAAAAAAWKSGGRSGDQGYYSGVNEPPTAEGISANPNPPKAMVAADPIYESISNANPFNPRPEPTRQASEHSISRKSLSESLGEFTIARKPLPIPPPVPAMLTTTRSREAPFDSSTAIRDDVSSGTPDYSSPRQSEDHSNQVPMPRARTGVLKTVGDPNLNSDSTKTGPDLNIPTIDFGVTHSLNPATRRPKSAVIEPNLTRSFINRPATAGGTPPRSSPQASRSPSNSSTPIDEKRLSWLGRGSPRPGHSRSSSYAWQPGSSVGHQSPGPSLSPEEFVQQRYAATRVSSGHVPHRSISSTKSEAVSPTPSKLQKRRSPSGQSSARNSMVMDYSTNLSAREQEHVARMTGSPLINMPERSRTPDPSVGLIGAIEAREQERRNMMQGVSGHMVQATIAQRQQQAQAQYMQAQQAAFGGYGYQQYPSYGSAGSQQGQWMNPQGQYYGNYGSSGMPQQQLWNNQPYPQRQSGYYGH